MQCKLEAGTAGKRLINHRQRVDLPAPAHVPPTMAPTGVEEEEDESGGGEGEGTGDGCGEGTSSGVVEAVKWAVGQLWCQATGCNVNTAIGSCREAGQHRCAHDLRVAVPHLARPPWPQLRKYGGHQPQLPGRSGQQPLARAWWMRFPVYRCPSSLCHWTPCSNSWRPASVVLHSTVQITKGTPSVCAHMCTHTDRHHGTHSSLTNTMRSSRRPGHRCAAHPW